MDDAGAAKYAEQQEQLARQLEDGHAAEIQIQAPKDPEVKPEVYRDVEPLIFRGFLTIAAEINGVRFVFKSLNQHEMDLLRWMHPEGKATADFWNQFLAYGVFMIDGVNILPERDRWIPKIADMFNSFQVQVRNRIVWRMSEINRRASNAVSLTECYAMERYSRYRWYQLQGMDMTATAVSGVSGTDRLGLNWAQLVWRALNRIEDLNDLQEQEWEHAKFVGSCMAGKGISKVYQQDNDRRRKAKEEQLARKDKLLRQVLLGEKLADDGSAGGAVMVAARTVEELASQLERDLRGEKDWHDLVVDEHERRIREGYNHRRRQLEEMARSREEEFGGKTLFGGTDMRGLTPAQVHDHLLRRREQDAQNRTAEAWPELHDEKLRGVMDRYVAEEPTIEIKPTDRDTSTALPVIPRPRGTPFRR